VVTGSPPPAAGAKVAWEDLPAAVRLAVEDACGAAVVRAQGQPGGFSPGVAARLRCADGSRAFVKAVSELANPDTPRMHRQEAGVLAALDPLIASGAVPAPRLRGRVDLGGWTVLVLDDIEGVHPRLPWRPDELDRLLGALDRLAEVDLQGVVGGHRGGQLPTAAESLAAAFDGWRTLAGSGGSGPDGGPPADLDAWSVRNLDRLAELEDGWADHVAGDALLHSDVRGDNVLLTAERVVLVDWPAACVGDPFVDPVLLAPSVAMQGGPAPGELLARSRSGRGADRDAVRAVVCAFAGYLTERALRPSPPGLPTLRAFQAAQGAVARAWLADLL
jgi:hypothetical protein